MVIDGLLFSDLAQFLRCDLIDFKEGAQMLLAEMILLGLAAFAAMVGFIAFCEWV